MHVRAAAHSVAVHSTAPKIANRVLGMVKGMTMMKPLLRGVFPGLAMICAIALQASPALASCEWYVKTSLEQQQRNLKLKCGFAGTEWSADKAAHVAWCASVSPDTSRSAAQKREAELGTCATK